jgi:5-dehydro-2-deoxygluconokinase
MSAVTERVLDVICLGRAAVDLYGQQIGGRLEDMQTFAKYLGGSSGNLAAGLARLGARSAMLTRVGDEQMGRFVRDELERLGVDVSHVRTDRDRLTALVILGIGSGGEIPHIFYRERCADMGLCEDDVDEAFIASARLLAITGTHASTPLTLSAVRRAISHAKAHGTSVLLDIDYRPVLWGVAHPGDGASRYAESTAATAALQSLLPDCDVVVGTEEEIAIAGGDPDVLTALKNLRRLSDAVVVLKRGAEGCTVFEPGDIGSLDQGEHIGGFPVEVFNTVGAGDAFLSGFLKAWLDGKPWAACGRLGNACGALVVARHGCTPAMPGTVELDRFLAMRPTPFRPRLDAELCHLHRVTTWQDDTRPLCVLAFDHRSQFEELAGRHGRPSSDIGRFKQLVAEVLLDVAGGDGAVRHGAIVDYRHGNDALNRLAASGLWTASPVEVPGSRPVEFEYQRGTGAEPSSWPAARIAKCLVFYHPDDPAELRHRQEEQLRALYADLLRQDRRLLLEIICPERDDAFPDPLVRALRRFYHLGVRPDWWKLPSQPAATWKKIVTVIEQADPHCKGIVILGLGEAIATLKNGFAIAAPFGICRGFAVGRSIFADAAASWFEGTIDDARACDAIRERYLGVIDLWCGAADVAEAL